MFPLSSGLSRFIKRDSFRCNLNLLLPFKRNVKSLKTRVMILHISRMWSMIAEFLGFFTHFLVRGVIPRCSEALTKN